MEGRVAQWGHSLALRIPRLVARELGLREGQSVDLEVRDGALKVWPRPCPPVTLEALLAGVTDENLHGETGWGGAEGQEEW